MGQNYVDFHVKKKVIQYFFFYHIIGVKYPISMRGLCLKLKNLEATMRMRIVILSYLLLRSY